MAAPIRPPMPKNPRSIPNPAELNPRLNLAIIGRKAQRELAKNEKIPM